MIMLVKNAMKIIEKYPRVVSSIKSKNHVSGKIDLMLGTATSCSILFILVVESAGRLDVNIIGRLDVLGIFDEMNLSANS